MRKTSVDALRSYFLWKGIDDVLWGHLSSCILMRQYHSGEEIDAATEGNLCILRSGRIKVYPCNADDTHTPMLRTMESGALFGVNNIFCSDAAPMSRLVAASACEIACIPAALWEEILYKNAVIMQRYVRFLTERIAFLNRKICYLTAGSTEQKLATYLSHTLPKDGTYVPLPLPAANLADLLDIGRASLYRAINKLTEDGFISHCGKEYALCQTFSSNDANSQQKNPPATE